MKEVNKTNAQLLRQDLTKALTEVANKHGLMLSVGTIGMYSTKFSVPCNFELPSESDAVSEQNKSYVHMYGLPEDTMSRTVTIQGRIFSIIGFNPNRPKFAVKLKDSFGKEAATTVASVKRLLS